jgi:hypothetical protein
MKTRCPLCRKLVPLGVLGMCEECLASELTWKSRPVGIGLCWKCSGNPVALHEWENLEHTTGLCASCRRAFMNIAMRDPPPPRPDIRGLYWDPNHRGGAWRV